MLFVENGFEDRELMYPYYRFQEVGYKVEVVGPRAKVTYMRARDKSVVIDGNLATSRFPADLPDFCRETLKLLQKK